MCGINGAFSQRSLGESFADKIRQTTQEIHSRGPDSEGFYFNIEDGIYLGHKRLAILDLSQAGHQPMESARYVLILNGEIYNFKELKIFLEKNHSFSDWRGNSDTEVLLALLNFYDLKDALQMCHGMFALALWDKREKKIFLARDRVGEKPLYYGLQENILFFASELKAIARNSVFKREISLEAVQLYTNYSYIPAPLSIYKDIFKLKPGFILEFDFVKEISIYPYWNVKETFSNSLHGNSLKENCNILENKLKKVIKRQMISDVPIGAFLSGGIDSTLVSSLMQAESIKPIRTFTIGFNSSDFDESDIATQNAKFIGSEHTNMYITHRDCLDIIPSLSNIYSEPFSDSSQIPAFLVSKLTKQHVTVALSGDGGDELFGGYNRYIFSKKVYFNSLLNNSYTRKIVSKLLSSLTPIASEKILSLFSFISSDLLAQHNLGEKIQKTSIALNSDSIIEFYNKIIQTWPNESKILNKPQKINFEISHDHIEGDIEKMMYLDFLNYLPDDILCKVDRAAMAVSLETRAPYLDHDIVEFANSLPIDQKIIKNQGKIILRNILRKYIPNYQFAKPKTGFAIPLANWLREPLKDWCLDTLNDNALRNHGFFNESLIEKILDQHMRGKYDWNQKIWNILMFQNWYNSQK